MLYIYTIYISLPKFIERKASGFVVDKFSITLKLHYKVRSSRCAELVEKSENLKSQNLINQLIVINSSGILLAAFNKVTRDRICNLFR